MGGRRGAQGIHKAVNATAPEVRVSDARLLLLAALAIRAWNSYDLEIRPEVKMVKGRQMRLAMGRVITPLFDRVGRENLDVPN